MTLKRALLLVVSCFHDGNTIGVNCTQVGVLEKADQVSFTGLLESQHSRTLEPQASLEVLGNFSHEALERQL